MNSENDIVLIGYPRSGMTWLQFILANLYFPDIEHDFSTIHKLIPSLDSEKEFKNINRVNPQFFKSHTVDYDCNTIIYIYRHVGDVLISFFHYFRKFYNLPDDFDAYLEKMGYGKDWRQHVSFYFHLYMKNMYGETFKNNKKVFFLRYENLVKEPEFWIESLKHWLGLKVKTMPIKGVMNLTSFDNMQNIEKEKGLNIYEGSNLGIPFIRKGKIGQWQFLPETQKAYIKEKNIKELKMLDYI